ncbi:MAG: DNA cytosine methyltransferase [Chloroflexi bacterium]|nr:DNA cytosine methyltransferase [Chloroflexota bacterium]
MLSYGSLFSGIGGLDLGFEQAGLRCKYQVEIEPDYRKILAANFPSVTQHADIRNVAAWDLPPVDILAGGFPCQDISVAGKRAGISGERSGLWSEYLRLIRNVRPKYVVIENVPNLLKDLEYAILRPLAEIGYISEWQSIRASDFGLPHRRERLFVVSYPDQIHGGPWMGTEQDGACEVFQDDGGERLGVRVQTPCHIDRVADGIPGKFYKPLVGGFGNAIAVPASRFIAERILRHYKQTAGGVGPVET